MLMCGDIMLSRYQSERCVIVGSSTHNSSRAPMEEC